jgi:hypothetical protein
MEGYIRSVAHPLEFYDSRFRRIMLMDNSILASPNCLEVLEWLASSHLLVDFNQGLDIRYLNEENARLLKQIRVKTYRFAFDHIGYEQAVKSGIALMDKIGVSRRKLSFYVLVGFESDDYAIERIKMLQSYNVDVYPMIYKGDDGKEPAVSYSFTETLPFHGARGNIVKFLRIAGRFDAGAR